jgi:hypothetical protein
VATNASGASGFQSDASGPAWLHSALGGSPRPMKRPNTPAYAVVRLDHFLIDDGGIDAARLERAVTVKEVLLDQAGAEAEVERLNRLNADKRCHYFCQYTRLVSGNES